MNMSEKSFPAEQFVCSLQILTFFEEHPQIWDFTGGQLLGFEIGIGIERPHPVEQLSGGQKQRLSITTALVHGPKVFFLDEPTTGLDPQARRHLWELIEKVRDKGISVIMTTHYMDEAEILCDRIAVMDNGKIVAIDTPKNLIKQLLGRGFKKKQEVQQANLEDVFIDLTGKELRDGS